MQDLKVALIQSMLHWQQRDANLAMFEEKIWQIDEQPNLIILPEMFNSGFTMQAEEVAEPMNFTTFKWMRQMAAQTNAVITGSFVVKENGLFYNRLVWMEPSGQSQMYDKRHLFRMADEHDHYAAGTEKIVCHIKGWRILPLICYDLRFPVWSRNQWLPEEKRMNYDLALYVANWPAARVKAWDILLQARSVENLSYTIGVNRVGTDQNEITYNGHSAIINPKGQQEQFCDSEECVITHTLKASQLASLRQKFPAHLDADHFRIET